MSSGHHSSVFLSLLGHGRWHTLIQLTKNDEFDEIFPIFHSSFYELPNSLRFVFVVCGGDWKTLEIIGNNIIHRTISQIFLNQMRLLHLTKLDTSVSVYILTARKDDE